MVWNKTYGGTGNDRVWSAVQTADGGYAIAGYTTSFGAGGDDVWLVKTDSAGDALWNHTYGGKGNDVAFSVVQTTDGGYALAGDTTSFGAGSWDFWLVKTDSTGNMVWNKTYDRTSQDWVWSVVQTSDGGYALAGASGSSSNAGLSDFWLVKTDSSGDMLWNQAYGGVNFDRGYSVVQTVDGGYIVAGETSSFGAGDSDVWLVKTDSIGNMVWNKTYGGANPDWARSVVQTSDGGYAIAGMTESFNSRGVRNAWLIKVAVAGSPIPSFTFSPPLPKVDEMVTFDASTSIDLDGRIVSYIWNFGDGNTINSTIPIMIHTYTASRTYNVSLIITDNQGLTSRTTKTVTIEAQEAWSNIFPYILAVATIVITVVASGIYLLRVRKRSINLRSVLKEIAVIVCIFGVVYFVSLTPGVGYLGEVEITRIEKQTLSFPAYAFVDYRCSFTSSPFLYPMSWLTGMGYVSGNFSMIYLPQSYYARGDFLSANWGSRVDMEKEGLIRIVLPEQIKSLPLLFMIILGVELAKRRILYLPLFGGIIGFPFAGIISGIAGFSLGVSLSVLLTYMKKIRIALVQRTRAKCMEHDCEMTATHILKTKDSHQIRLCEDHFEKWKGESN